MSSQNNLNSVGGRDDASDDVRLTAEDIALMPVEVRLSAFCFCYSAQSHCRSGQKSLQR